MKNDLDHDLRRDTGRHTGRKPDCDTGRNVATKPACKQATNKATKSEVFSMPKSGVLTLAEAVARVAYSAGLARAT